MGLLLVLLVDPARMGKLGQEAADKNHVPGAQGETAVSLASLQAGGPAVEPVA